VSYVRRTREALAANLGVLDAYAHVSPYMLAQPVPPAIQVAYVEEVDYDAAMQRSSDEWTWIVQAFAGLLLDQAAQETLDSFLDPSGPTSIKAAIESDRTLGGIADDLRVRSADGYRVYTIAGVDVLGCQWMVDVLGTV